MIIAFQTSQIDVRGTCVALYDYALYNETILGNTSIVVTDKRNVAKNDLVAIRKFANRFPVIFYDDAEHLHRILKEKKCDMMYTIKYGKKDEIVFDDIKTVIHCVFDLSEPHGDVYAAVSKALAKKYNYPLYVPHMIGLSPSKTKENMREFLGIPDDAIVFGRHGGVDTFNIPFVHDAIRKLIVNHSNLWFVFMGAPHFIEHPRVIYLPLSSDLGEKNRFIQTCDAHLECGTLGHSFGLAMGEFSVNNKPIIAFLGKVWNTAHYDILKNNALYFRNQEEFERIITTFNPELYKDRDLNCYKDFSPEKVMKIFNDVFIQGTVQSNV
jgi:hypothetical protein